MVPGSSSSRDPDERPPVTGLRDRLVEHGPDDGTTDGRGLAAQPPQDGAHEELEGDEAADRVAGQPEEQAVAAVGPRCAPVGERLAGLDGDPPEVERAELLEDLLHDVVGPHGHATAGDQDVGREDALDEELADGLHVVERDAEAHRLGSRRHDLRGDRLAVAVGDRGRSQRLAAAA